MKCLSGKTALVTDVACEMGRAGALALAKAGAQVLVHYGGADQEADAVVAEIRALGAHAQKVAADLRTPEGPYRLARRVRVVIGARLDVLVVNASITKNASIEETSVEAFDALFSLNVRAPYFLVQQLMPTMCKGSSIVMVSARAAMDNASAYAATQGAINTLVTHFASTLGPRGVRVNGISPGEVTPHSSDFVTMEIARMPGSAGLGNAVVFLASDAARWITGDTLHIGGGSTF